MQLPDVINGGFEAFGAWAVWKNVARLRKDRDVKGIVWEYQVVFWIWGLWNIFYYPNLHQWFSTAAAIVLMLGNMTWVALWLKILKDKEIFTRNRYGL